MGNKWADKLRADKKKEKRAWEKAQKASIKDSTKTMRPLYKEIKAFVEDYYKGNLRPEDPHGDFELRFEGENETDCWIEFVSHFRDDGIWFEYDILTVTYCSESECFELSMNEGETKMVAKTVDEAMEGIVNTRLRCWT